jgi:large subunit ribosomal protein L25
MPDTYAAEPRTALGKAAARLRREAIMPANIYGRGLESKSVQLAEKDALALLRAHGVNTLISLQVAGEGNARPVVVRKVQRHPVSHKLQHVDFYQVDLQRPITGLVPVTVTGESPAVHTYQGVLLHGADTVQVEALPAQMPTHLEVSVESITELDGQVTVADLVVPSGVTVLTAPDVMLARVTRPRVEEELPAVPEGEQPAAAEGEAPAAEASAEESPQAAE